MLYDTFVTDWDFTLARSDRTVSDETKWALTDFQDAGGLWIVCSGRPLRGVKAAAARSDVDLSRAIIISSNGGEATTGSGERLVSCPLDENLVRAVWLRALKLQFVPLVLSGEAAFTTNATYPPIMEEVHENQHDVTEVRNVSELDATNVSKMLLTRAPCVPQSAVHVLTNVFEGVIEATISEPQFLEVTRHGASKGKTLEGLLKTLGRDPERTVMIGDSHNDLSMVDAVGCSAAVANAVTELREAADLIVDSNDEDGVAKLLRHVMDGRTSLVAG